MRALAVVALAAGDAFFHFLVRESAGRLGFGTMEDREQRRVTGRAVGFRLVDVRRVAERDDARAVRSLRKGVVARKAGKAPRENRPGQSERQKGGEESETSHDGSLTFPRGTAGPARPSGPRRALARCRGP